MDTDTARAHLARAGRGRLDKRSGRRTHGLAVIAFGVVFGMYLALSVPAEAWGGWVEQLILAAYVVTLGAIALLQTTARTVPRHAKALAWTGLAGTLPQLLGATMFFNVFDDPPAVMLIAAGALAALPMVVAGISILRDARR